MSDGTTIALSLGPAAITGAVGYLAARIQSRSAVRSAEIENERLRLEHRETARQQRQATYHEFLVLMHRLDAMMAGFADMTKESFAKWLDDFELISGAIDLFGGVAVRLQVSGVRDELDAIGLQARRRGGAGTFEQRFAHAYQAHRESLTAVVDPVVEAMRTDVASA